MAENYKSLIINFVLIGVFAFSIILFSVKFSNENQTSINLNQIDYINSTISYYEDNLTSFEEQSIEQKENFDSDQTTITDEVNLLSSVGVARVFVKLSIGLYNISLGLVFRTLFGYEGNSSFQIISGVIAGIIILIIILYTYRLIKVGE